MKYAVKEYAATAVDIIARRLRLSFLNVQAAEESLPVIVQIMGDELGWDKKERERQTEEATTFLRMQMGKDVNKASQDNIPVSLTKAEIAEYVKRFNALDDGKKGYISINDIRKSLKVCPDKNIIFHLFSILTSPSWKSKVRIPSQSSNMSILGRIRAVNQIWSYPCSHLGSFIFYQHKLIPNSLACPYQLQVLRVATKGSFNHALILGKRSLSSGHPVVHFNFVRY